MKRFLLYSVGGTAIFMAGAATATVIVGRMVLPVIDTDKVVDKVMRGLDTTQRAIERKVFGEELAHPPMIIVDQKYKPSLRYNKSSSYGE